MHVYGQHTGVGEKRKGTTQHIGLGSKLLKRAELTAYVKEEITIEKKDILWEITIICINNLLFVILDI